MSYILVVVSLLEYQNCTDVRITSFVRRIASTVGGSEGDLSLYYWLGKVSSVIRWIRTMLSSDDRRMTSASRILERFLFLYSQVA